jgi:uncharacterized protein YukE
MHIDHAELEQATRAFTTEGHDLAVLVDQLLGRIDRLGDVYGDDDPGRQAKQAFDRARDDVARYAGALCDAYGTIGAHLALMNANVETADWNGIAALPAVDLTTVPRFGS